MSTSKNTNDLPGPKDTACICKGYYQPAHCPVHGTKFGLVIPKEEITEMRKNLMREKIEAMKKLGAEIEELATLESQNEIARLAAEANGAISEMFGADFL